MKILQFLLFALVTCGVSPAFASCEGAGCIEPEMRFANECDVATGNLEVFLGALERSCESDAQCEAKFLRVSSCAAPVIVRFDALGGEQMTRLTDLQDAVRKECAGAPEPLCAPQVMQPACVNGQCVAADTAALN